MTYLLYSCISTCSNFLFFRQTRYNRLRNWLWPWQSYEHHSPETLQWKSIDSHRCRPTNDRALQQPNEYKFSPTSSHIHGTRLFRPIYNLQIWNIRPRGEGWPDYKQLCPSLDSTKTPVPCSEFNQKASPSWSPGGQAFINVSLLPSLLQVCSSVVEREQLQSTLDFPSFQLQEQTWKHEFETAIFLNCKLHAFPLTGLLRLARNLCFLWKYGRYSWFMSRTMFIKALIWTEFSNWLNVCA